MGIVLLLIGGVNEAFTKRAAILSPRLFKVSFGLELFRGGVGFDRTTQTRTTGCLLAVGFLQNAVFIAAML